MARKGDSYTMIPTLWHMGFNKPCRVVRKRRGQTRWQSRDYQTLTEASARRWWRLSKAGKAIIRRDVNREVISAFLAAPMKEAH